MPGGKTVGDYTSKTEAFLKKTKDMPIGEFTQYIKEERSLDVADAAAVPQAIQYLSSVAANESVLRDLVVSLKRQGLIDGLMEVLMDYPESYRALTNLLGEDQKGASRCNNLVRTMNEIVGPPIGLDDEMGADEPTSRRLGDEIPSDEDEDDYPEDDEEDEDEDDMDDDDWDDEDEDDWEDEDEDEDEDDMDDDDMDDEELDSPVGGKEMGLGKPSFMTRQDLMGRGKFAMDHLIHALNKYLKQD
jgi:hypothetical protein